MKYAVKLYNDWNTPYWSQSFEDGKRPLCRSIEQTEYVTDSLEVAKTMVKDLLDAPDYELTYDQVIKDFQYDRSSKLNPRNVAHIQSYYNWRYGLYKTVIADIDAAVSSGILKYDIPYQYNHFEVLDEHVPPEETQISAYLQITMTEN